MPIFPAALGSVSGLAFLSHLFNSDTTSQTHHHRPHPSSVSALTNTNPSYNFPNSCRNSPIRRYPLHTAKVSVSEDAKTEGVELLAAASRGVIEDSSASPENIKAREKSRITLSIKLLQEDPLLETLDKVIPQDGSVVPGSFGTTSGYNIEPLPGLEAILEELLQEEGISDIRISRQGFEKRVVSQDLQLWLSNAPAIGKQFTLLARAGRQVQEIQLTTSLDPEGIKRALQRVLERVP